MKKQIIFNKKKQVFLKRHLYQNGKAEIMLMAAGRFISTLKHSISVEVKTLAIKITFK